jgi:hypothetical protein
MKREGKIQLAGKAYLSPEDCRAFFMGGCIALRNLRNLRIKGFGIIDFGGFIRFGLKGR